MKPDLILLTYGFPNKSNRSEDWLKDEMMITAASYNTLKIFPDEYSGDFNPLPANCEIIDYDKIDVKINLNEMLAALGIVLSDYTAFPVRSDFFKTFRYNFSLVRTLLLKAKKISTLIKPSANTIVYAYWADNLATKASIIKKLYHSNCKIVTRAHGFEIFEEQTKYKMIPFRNFQLKQISCIYADSKRGMEYLHKKHPLQKKLSSYAYVGTKDLGSAHFNDTGFAIVSCSFIRDVKRLHLMAGILKHIDFELTWHVLGNGEDLERLQRANSELPSNIKVIYHGYLDNAAVLNFYKNTSINLFVSLSYSEGLPVTMMEAQSFGLPIMSTNVGGCKEICNEQTGFLIEKDFDAKEIALKIADFKNSHKNTASFRDNCRKYWENNFNALSNYTNFSRVIAAL